MAATAGGDVLPSLAAHADGIEAQMRHWQDPNPVICQAHWEGLILEQAVGSGGFGYDPLFYVPDQACASAELSRDSKNRISHRGQALQLLMAALQREFT